MARSDVFGLSVSCVELQQYQCQEPFDITRGIVCPSKQNKSSSLSLCKTVKRSEEKRAFTNTYGGDLSTS